MAEWHPIRVVARRTGLSPHVIRAWEKRYRAVTPKRTPTNRRVYSTDDVERLSLLRRATLAGRSIGQIAQLGTSELRALVAEDEAAQSTAPRPAAADATTLGAEGGQLLARCLEAAERLDGAALQSWLDRASVTLSRPALLQQLIVPLMQRMGDAWKDGTLRVAHEHLATAVVRSFVGNLNGAFYTPEAAPEIVVTTPAGQLHEIGGLLVAATAAAQGWRTTYLGPSLPAEEIAAAVHQNEAKAVGLSIIYPTDDPHLAAELNRLRHLLPPNFPILVGGRGAPSYASTIDALGLRYLPDIDTLRQTLDDLRASRE